MNIHPLLVHFPIGFLVVYSFLEIGSLVPALRRQTWVSGTKAFLLFAGVAAAFLALVTGGMAEDLIVGTNPRAHILTVHEPFAIATTCLYLILAASYSARIFDQKGWNDRIVGANSFLMRLLRIDRYITHLILDTWALPLIALFGFVSLTITGALGAAIVYGPDIDPTVSFIYHLFLAK